MGRWHNARARCQSSKEPAKEETDVTDYGVMKCMTP